MLKAIYRSVLHVGYTEERCTILEFVPGSVPGETGAIILLEYGTVKHVSIDDLRVLTE
jgi:hypothetical protein